jgi:CRISPR system Cascade subunit CasA
MPDEPYNLTHERWIPVRDEDGNVWDIAPWEMTTDRAAPRPDFDGALIQFLIGLVQTAFAPETEREWRTKFKNPPGADELQGAFERYEHAFNLDGDGPRFMQDYDFIQNPPTFSESDKKKLPPISYLLVDTPTSSPPKPTLPGKEHFNKERFSWAFSRAAAAMALLAMQINAPGGGAGYRVSVRGKGPLSTVVLGETLWQTVWLNVLTEREFEVLGSAERDGPLDKFPWLDSGQTSESDATKTPQEVHAAQMYWATPRRKLLLSFPQEETTCALLPPEDAALYTHYHRKNRGINYDNDSPWQHPLTPLLRESQSTVKVHRVSDLSYQHWTGFTAHTKGDVQPALVVQKFTVRANYQSVRQLLDSSDEDTDQPSPARIRPRIWAFGYEIVKNNKAFCWRDSTMPLFTVAPEVRVPFGDFAHQLVSAAEYFATRLKTALKRGLYGEKKNGDWKFPTHIKRKGKKKKASQMSILNDTATRFWRDTEPLFFDYLDDAQRVLEDNKEDDPEEDLTLDLRRKWLKDLREHLMRLYDEVTASSTFHGADPKSVALARRDLRRAASAGNEDIRKKLNLPKEKAS